MDERLLPCPFCGSSDVKMDDNSYVWFVRCAGCNVSCSVAVRYYPADMSIPVNAWNRRAASTGDGNGNG